MARLCVAMPAYNAGGVIRAALMSIIESPLQDYFILVLDDGSTDNTAEICEAIAARHPSKIELLRQNNMGTASARHLLFAHAATRAEYVAWADADDIQLPRRWLKQLNLLEKRKDFIGVGGWCRSFGTSHAFIHRPCSADLVDTLQLFGNPIAFPTFTVRTMAYRVHGINFDQSLRSSEDYDFIAQLLRVGKLANVPSVTTLYRRHPSQESTANKVRQSEVHLDILTDIVARKLQLQLDRKQAQILGSIAARRADATSTIETLELMFRAACETDNVEIHALRTLLSYVVLRSGLWPKNRGRLRKADWFSLASIPRYFKSSL